MIQLVLENNNFSLGTSEHYIQVNGTAIGSKLGRNYACTYLGKWETLLLNLSELKPFVYFRYIDDIFGIWLHGEESLRSFYHLANNLHSQIKLELRHSTEYVEFLDVRVGLCGDTICTHMYSKPSETKAYLHYTSDHPAHTKRGISKGLAIRAKRICSTSEGFDQEAKDIRENLCSRGYPKKQVIESIQRVKEMDRSNILQCTNKRKNREGVPLILTYSSHLPNINKIIKQKSYILSRSSRLKTIFDGNIFASYKKGASLGDTLVHKKTRQISRENVATQGSCQKNCCVCKVIGIRADKMTGPGRRVLCTYDRSIGCRSRNIIYGVYCEVCEVIVYVGETGGQFYQRVQNHLSSIRCEKTELHVAAHFNSVKHGISDVKFVGLEKVWKNWTIYRRIREQRWMTLLGTHQGEGGLNSKTT